MMGNTHGSPDLAIPMILNCVQAHLATREELPTPTTHILLGAQGVDTPYGCGCDGLLIVEARGPIAYDRDQQANIAMIDGSASCDEVPHSSYRVTYKMCAPPFDATATNGSPPKVAERNALAILVMNETWLLFQALTCCIPSQYARVHSANHKIVNGCATLWVDIKMEHETCC